VPQVSRWLFTAGNELFGWAGGNTTLAAIGSSLFRFWA